MAIFEPKPWVNPFGKTSIFRILEPLVFIAQKRLFSSQNIEKVILLTYSARKKNVGKMAIIGPKPWVNPFGKSSIFRHSKLLVFIAKKGVFSTFGTSCIYCLERRFFNLEYRKSHFLNQYCLRKMIEKWPYWDQNHGLTPLEKCQFFDFQNFLFLLPTKALFRSRLS